MRKLAHLHLRQVLRRLLLQALVEVRLEQLHLQPVLLKLPLIQVLLAPRHHRRILINKPLHLVKEAKVHKQLLKAHQAQLPRILVAPQPLLLSQHLDLLLQAPNQADLQANQALLLRSKLNFNPR